MTRDEAFKKIGDVQFMSRDQWLVHCLSSLGMLDLDDPRSVRDRLNDAWCETSPSQRDIPNLLTAIDRAGLKIVEK